MTTGIKITMMVGENEKEITLTLDDIIELRKAMDELSHQKNVPYYPEPPMWNLEPVTCKTTGNTGK